MLTTYDRLMHEARVTRRGSVTVDNRSEHELVRQLQAEVEALRARIHELESAGCNRSDAVSSRHEVAWSEGVADETR